MSLIIAGERSGVGKTTLTLALLAYLTQKGYKVQSFKVGPDYIDPMFHSKITGYPCRNLDPILTSETYVKTCFNHHCQGKEIAIVEGVMGLFDGVHFEEKKDSLYPDYASTAHIARLLNIPIALVIDCSHLSTSIAAIALGYQSLDPRLSFAGVILNRVASDRHLDLLTDALNSVNIPILGVFYRQDALNLPSRHLGLIPTDEFPNLAELFDKLAFIAEKSFNWPLISPYLPITLSSHHPLIPSHLRFPKIKIAIAKDQAFNFYYQDNLDILEQLGAELHFFSPLKDKSIPKDCQGLIFGGGFPEIFAQELSENLSIIQSICQVFKQKIPIYAECGGLMYLSKAIIDFKENNYPMVGILPTQTKMSSKLTLGYKKAIKMRENWLLSGQKSLWGHEFHRSQLTHPSLSPLFTLKSVSSKIPETLDGWGIQSLYASYLHLHWGTQTAIAENFLQACLDFPKKLR